MTQDTKKQNRSTYSEVLKKNGFSESPDSNGSGMSYLRVITDTYDGRPDFQLLHVSQDSARTHVSLYFRSYGRLDEAYGYFDLDFSNPWDTGAHRIVGLLKMDS